MRALVIAVVIGLGGCAQIEAWQHPELATCEEYTRSTLKSPATYKRVRTFISDDALPLAYWQERSSELLGDSAASFADLDKTYAEEGGVRSVTFEYDAENAFGVPMRGVASCKFEMTSFEDEKFSTEPSATSAQASLAAVQAGLKDDDELIGCCVSKSVSDRLDKYASQRRFVAQQEIK